MAMPLDESSMAAGVLMGSGLRELSQVLGLSRKKSGGMAPDGAQPNAASMAQGQMGDIDKILMLAKLQGQGPGGPQPGGPMPPGPPLPGMPPGLPGQAMPPAPSPPIAPPSTPGGLAAPLPQPGAPSPIGMPPLGGGAPLAPPNPLMGALGGAAPGGGMGGGLPMQLLMQLLQGSQGLV